MWTYILRRILLMIPTLFGITIVSFCVMQLAPGDPVLQQISGGGTAGHSTQTPEAFRQQKRDLRLDRPLLLNARYFRDYTQRVQTAAWVLGADEAQLAEDLRGGPQDAQAQARWQFFRSLGVARLDEVARSVPTDEQLAALGMARQEWEQQDEERRLALAKALPEYVKVWCNDHGAHGVPAAMAILESPDADRRLKIGAVRVLAEMVLNPFRYTFSRQPTEEEARRVAATWRLLWEQEGEKFPPVDPDRAKVLSDELAQLAHLESRRELFERIQEFDRDDASFFAEVLFNEQAPLAEKAIAAEILRLFVSARLNTFVAVDADDDQLAAVVRNWQAHYRSHPDAYHFTWPEKLWGFVADTQYAHMVWRLVTFNFGRSALKTREPVSEKIWSAVVVSAPLMIMAQAIIYLVAVPLGILCAVRRNKPTDRLISQGLYFLYSVPAFVAGMLFLLFFCYGSYFKWFPMERLHSPGAENWSWGPWLLDYLWHATLPVICLSLFSLAGLAMYSRTSMLEVLQQDYIRTARAKGASSASVIFKHALRNALIPIITLFANFLPAMLGGSVLIEYLFNIPGMGRLSFTSIYQKDFPTLMALIYIDAIVVMISILLTDLLYVFVDPRISFEGTTKG